MLNLTILRKEEELSKVPKTRLITNLESIKDNFNEFGVTESVKALLMTDPLMAERIEGKTDDEIIEAIAELHKLAVSTEAAKTVTDPVLGKVQTKDGKYGWDYTKVETHTILGKKIPVKIVINSEKITDHHRDSYAWFKKNVASLDKAMRKELEAYAKMVEDYIGKDQYTYDPKHLDALEIKEVLLKNQKKDGDHKVQFVVLGECPWDDEHGFGCEVVVDKDNKVNIYVAQYGTFI